MKGASVRWKTKKDIKHKTLVGVKYMVIVYCKEQGDIKVKRALGWLRRNNIEYKIKEVNEDNFTYETFLHFLKMTVTGMDEILSKKGDGRRAEIIDGEHSDKSLSGIYDVIIDDPEYLDLPLLIDERGRTATLGTRRENKEYENLTVFRQTKPVDKSMLND